MTKLRLATHETFASLSVRNFRLFFAGQTISQVGNWLTLVAQALLVLKITGNGFDVGLLTAFQFAPVLVLGPWAGLVADRSDKRKLLMAVQVFAMFQSFALVALAFMDRPPIAALYLVALLGGVATAFDNPARRSFVVEMVDEERVNNAVSLNSALMTGSRVIGPALAGLLITTVGYGWCFVVDAVSYVAVIIGYALMDPSKIRRGPATPRGRGQVRAGLRYAMGKAELRIPLVMMAIIGTLAFNFTVVMPLMIKQELGGTDGTFTAFFSVLSAGSLVGALLTARRAAITIHDVVLSAVGFGVTMTALAFAPNLLVAFPVGVLFGAASIGFMTASTSIVQVEADPAMRGRVLALQAMVFLGSTPIGGPILGQICDSFGARAGVLVGGVATLVAAGYGWLAARRLPGGADVMSIARPAQAGIDTPIPPRVSAP